MVEWIEQLRHALAGGEDCVLVTVVGARGSTPRECGAKMVVTAERIIGSIGGGNLEYASIGTARTLLGASSSTRAPLVSEFALGARLGQCCGGHASVLFERVSGAEPWLAACAGGAGEVDRAVLVTVTGDGSKGARSIAGAKVLVTTRGVHGHLGRKRLQSEVIESARTMLCGLESPEIAAARLEPAGRAGSLTLLYEPLWDSRPRLWLFGAGHVGRALVAVLGDSPCRIVWVDGRPEQFPRAVPGNVEVRISELPVHCIDEASTSDSFLVMTHSHALDLQLVERVLASDEFRFLGLIGSGTKRRRFEKQLLRRGVAEDRLARLVCPIGIPGITGKHPRSIAVAAAAQLLRLWECDGQAVVDTGPDRSQHDAGRHGPKVGAR